MLMVERWMYPLQKMEYFVHSYAGDSLVLGTVHSRLNVYFFALCEGGNNEQ